VRPPYTSLKEQVIARLAVPGRRRREDRSEPQQHK